MDELIQLEQAYKTDDHESSRDILASIRTDEVKEKAFLNIITHYEGKGLFPVGYSLMFIKWLLQKNDAASAMKYILQYMESGVPQEKISKIVYEYLIKPGEAVFRETFNRNLELLKNSRVLFTGMDFDFEQAKNDISIIANYQDDFLIDEKDADVLLVDVINMKIISSILEKSNIVYLIFDDMNKFYYTLMFEDLSVIENPVREKKIVFFADNDTAHYEKFFAEELIHPPTSYYDLSRDGEYRKKMKDLTRVKIDKAAERLNSLKKYYGGLGKHYYRDLLSGPPSGIKVLLIASETTEINKFITRNWCRAFLELGYQARLLIENEPYEIMSRAVLYREIDEYKPDIVFNINYTVNDTFADEEIRNNLIWIMRYRDLTDIHSTKKEKMFVISMVKEWTEDIEAGGFPGRRLLYIPDGVDLNIFVKNEALHDKYACDVVSVNNSGGDEFYRFTKTLEMFKDNDIKRIIHELYSEINEMVARRQFVFYDESFLKILNNKLIENGLWKDIEHKKYIVRYFTLMMFAVYRRTVVEWIADSGITNKIKVWGRGWSNHEKFKKYHMGVARHGEELANIYGHSRISISDHPNNPLHERTYEILSSGGFPLVKHVQPENDEDIDYLTHHFKENEEIVMFYNKEDLLNKVQYYLDNPQERDRIAENGRNVVKRDFSSVAVTEKTMEFIKNTIQNET